MKKPQPIASLSTSGTIYFLKSCILQNYKKLKKYFEVVDAEDTAIAYLAALSGGEQLHVAPASVEIVSQRDAISEFKDRSVGFPD